MIVLIGKSGSGKTAIRDCLIEKYQYKKIISCTTRAPREKEQDGVDYFFLTKEEFLQKVKNKEFAECTIYNGAFYGILNNQIHNDAITIVEPQGVKQLKDIYGNQIIVFEIWASEDKRRHRMKLRGDNEVDIDTRLAMDEIVFHNVEALCDFWSPNEADDAVETIADYIQFLHKRSLELEKE